MGELSFDSYKRDYKLTHYLFRFPAKFHPPAIRCLVDRYSEAGDIILDPFCGSGTLLVEAIVAGRHAVGVDIDPVARFISKVKSRPIAPRQIESATKRLLAEIDRIRRSPLTYERFMFDDLARGTLDRYKAALRIPPIPNITHWFRNYVIVDLAKLKNTINSMSFSPDIRNFFLACFASIIRNASNADPVPVSGLEVTSHMKRLDERGRYIDPFELFEQRVRRESVGMSELWENRSDTKVRVIKGDATTLRTNLGNQRFDVVITSPPYNMAVDYHRRHTLETYWLDLVRSPDERRELGTRYLGRVQVRKDNVRLRTEFKSTYVNKLIAHARKIDAARARAVVHYCASMSTALRQMAASLRRGGQAVIVVGNSKWNGKRVRATHLIEELARSTFSVTDIFSYPAQNRYMSYQRHNGADVDREYVMVLKKRSQRT